MKYFIIAYNYNEALKWVTLNKQRIYKDYQVQPGESMYLESANDLIGIENPRGIFVGRWYQRKDIKDILIQLQISDKFRTSPEAIEKAWKYIDKEGPMNI